MKAEGSRHLVFTRTGGQACGARSAGLCLQKQKTPRLFRGRGFLLKGSLALTYFRAVYLALSSALPRFTVLFGMGRRGSRALWAPDIACRLAVFTARPIRKEARL